MKAKCISIVFFLVVLCILSPIQVNSQTLDKLDEKNGFKTMKLGEPKSKYSNEIEYYKTNIDDSSTVYLYTGSDLNLYKVYTITFQTIKLIFDKNSTLVGVSHSKTYSSADYDMDFILYEYKTLRDYFMQMFGSDIIVIDTENPNEMTSGCEWRGKKTLLMVTSSMAKNKKYVYLDVKTYSVNFMNRSFDSGY